MTHSYIKNLSLVLMFAVSACSSESTGPEKTALSDPSWDIQYTDSTTQFIGLYVVNETTVWAAGSGGRFVRTSDGGATWTSGVVPGADSLQFRDVHAFDDQSAFLLSIGGGTDSRFYRTTDGGDTWTMVFQNQDPNSFFDCFSFWDRERGVAFSDSYEGEFKLMRTLDGGESWTRIPPESVPDAHEGEGAFAASGTCVVTRPGGLGWFSTGASGVDTRVIRTTDYGETWEESVTPIASSSSSSGIFTLSFLTDEQGVAMGGEYAATDTLVLNTAVTFDGGETWREGGQSNLEGSIYGASYVPGTPTPTIVAVAPTGTDYSVDNGMTWTRIDSSDYWSVHFVAADAGWAAGPGAIARIRNQRAQR